MLKNSEITDFCEIKEIMKDARARISLLGIDQWQDGYPWDELILNDIKQGVSYVLREADGRISGTVSLICAGEPDYDKIYGGEWLTGGTCEYLTMHRVAVASGFTGRGIASCIMNEAAKLASELGLLSVRADTHPENLPMRSALEKNGFKYCGVIYTDVSEGFSPERVAYEKIVNK